MKYIFSTEGHILPLKREFRKKPWEDYDDDFTFSTPKQDTSRLSLEDEPTIVDARTTNFSNNVRIKDIPIKDVSAEPENVVVVESTCNVLLSLQCDKLPEEKSYFLPIGGEYLRQIEALVGLDLGDS